MTAATVAPAQKGTAIAATRQPHHTLMVPDVFGATEDFHQLARSVADSFTVIDAYRHFGVAQPDPAAGDTAAYDWFQEHIGLERYTSLVTDAVRSVRSVTRIIGCSMGAAAVWKASASVDCQWIECGVCCYGGQIRHMAHLTPHWPLLCVLPKSEPHFDVEQLGQTLARHPHVVVHTIGQHGFLNAHSHGFERAARDSFTARLRNLNTNDELFPQGD
ncbi:MAG: dienelactone hydrolase family protein [Planctomycetaceae bacterium]|nr:dienelactone hydrolase family protein [Planctomycetaceae bacterium]